MAKFMPEHAKNNVIETLKKPSNPELVQQFKQYNEKLDQYRTTKFDEVFPELKDYI
jgi:hypothetical protein